MLQCPICLGLPRPPVVATRCCGQSFCEECLRATYQRKRECPLCRKTLRWKEDVIANRALDSVLPQIRRSEPFIRSDDEADTVASGANMNVNTALSGAAGAHVAIDMGGAIGSGSGSTSVQPQPQQPRRSKGQRNRERRRRMWIRRRWNWFTAQTWRFRWLMVILFMLTFMLWLYNYQAPTITIFREYGPPDGPEDDIFGLD